MDFVKKGLKNGKVTGMTILAVKIDTLATLGMNEFFDYAGYCWAVSRNRASDEATGVELEDFYEGTVQSGYMQEVPVVFLYENQIIGWYEKADVYRYIRHPALFLEGNIRTETRNARRLKRPAKIPGDEIVFPEDKNYLVIERGDIRYETLTAFISDNKGPFEVIEYARVIVDSRLKGGQLSRKAGKRLTNQGQALLLLMQCEALAAEIMEDRCPGIGTVKGFYELALDATRYDSSNVNGWYYLAMANYQLGFVKKGLKAIERALKLEPEGDDLLVMKGNLLVSNRSFEEALRCYEAAYELNPDDSYYIMAGRACVCMGNSVAANQYYRRVKDASVLKEFEITLSRKRFR